MTKPYPRNYPGEDDMPESSTFTIRRCYALARPAGRNILHRVYDWDGELVGERRSAHRYHYAICRRTTAVGGRATVFVIRFSRSERTSGDEFALRIEDE